MRSREEIAQAAEHVRIALAMAGENKTLELQRDVLRWALGEDGTKFGELVRRSLASAMPPVAEDCVTGLCNLGGINRRQAEQATRQAIAELPGADFEQLFRRCLQLARPPAAPCHR